MMQMAIPFWNSAWSKFKGECVAPVTYGVQYNLYRSI